MTALNSKTNNHLAERMAVHIAKRFGDYGFDDIKDDEVRQLLNGAAALFTREKPSPGWWIDRNKTAKAEIAKLKKISKKRKLRKDERDDLDVYQDYVKEVGEILERERQSAANAALTYPVLYEEFERLTKRKKK